MRSLRSLLAAVALASLTGCGARTVLSEPGTTDASVLPDVVFPVDEGFPQPDVVFPQPDVVFPDTVFVDDFVAFPDVVFPQPDVVFPDVVFPQPDVAFPDVVFPQPDVVFSGNEVCERALAVPPNATIQVSTAGATMTLPPCPGSTFAGGAVRWFRTTVPAGATLDVSSLSGPTPLIRIYPGCGTTACIGQNLLPGTGASARWTSTFRSPVDVVVAVGAISPGASTNNVIRTQIVTTPENARCASATELRSGVPVTGVIDLGGDTPMSCAVDVPGQPAVWYRVRVPAGQFLSARLTATPGLRRGMAVRVANACGGACVAASSSNTDGSNMNARWTNRTGADADALISVAPTTAGSPQDFSLVATVSAPPTNTACASATAVTNGTSLPNQDPSFATEVQPPCPGMTGSGAPSLFYRTTVPAGQTLFVTATPSVAGRLGPVIRVIPSCGSPVCFAASSSTGTGTAAAFANTARTDQPVVIAVGATDTRSAVPFTLGVSIRPPAPNGTCATPTRVVNGTTLSGESLGDGRDAPTACAVPGRDGRALYYAVRVGAGEQLAVLARRVDTTFPTAVVRLFDRCGATTCLAQSTQMSNAARLSYVNTTGAAQELLFAVNVQDGGASTTARVDLTVAVSRPAYAISAITAACDPMVGNVIAGAVGDDVGTPSVPLPFAFTYFGAPVAQWSVSTNGYLQLWPMSGRSTGALGVSELPNAQAPTGMVAALWDDLEVASGEGDVRWQVVDGPSRHLTAQWTNTRFCCGGGNPDRVTFQIKLFERTGVIEYHYCALSGSARTTGSNASIGMQDTSALRGVSYALRRAGAVMTGAGLRFTP